MHTYDIQTEIRESLEREIQEADELAVQREVWEAARLSRRIRVRRLFLNIQNIFIALIA